MIYGIFGGSFNPPHVAHYIAARDVFEQTNVDKIIVIPSSISPLKDNESLPDPIHRFEMCKKTFTDVIFSVSNIESKHAGKVTYTINTIRELANSHAGNKLKLIIGADQYNQFRKWHEYKQILELAKLVVMNRGGVKMHTRKSSEIIPADFVKVTNIELSSTQIRQRIKERKSVRYLVSPQVENYINKNNLYRR